MRRRLMSRLLALSIGAQISLMALIVVLPAAGIIVYSGLKLREAAIDAALLEAWKICDGIASQQQHAADSAEQLMTALAQLPDLRNHNVQSTRKIFADILAKAPLYLNISALDPDGTVWASAITSNIVSVADRRYFKTAMDTGRLSSGEYIVSRMAGKPTLNLCYPFKDGSGKVVGALSVAFYLDRLGHALPLPHSEPYRFTLLDHRGVVVGTSKPRSDALGTEDLPPLYRGMQIPSDQGSFVGTDAAGTRRFYCFRRLRLKGEPHPYLYVRSDVPVTATVERVNAVLGRNLIIFVSSLACGVLAALLIGKHSIVNRVAILRAASQRLAQGDLKVRVSHRLVGGELGELGEAFDEMALQLEARERERAKAERARRRSESRYGSLFENSLFGIVALGTDCRFLRVNKAFCKLLGYRPEELVGVRSVMDLTHPDDLAPSMEKYRALTRGEITRYTIEKRYLTKSGRVVYAVCFVDKIRNDEDYGEGSTACILDITELKESQERMRLFFERQIVGMAIASADRRWLQTNAKLQQLLGYSGEELAGRSWEEFSHPEDVDKSLEHYGRMMSGEVDEYVIEKRYLHREGTELHAIVSVCCVRRHDGTVDYVLALFDDITERTRAQREIDLLQTCLEQRVQERTAQLERAVNEHEAFSYSVSHDLRSPLRHINSYLAILQDEFGDLLPEEARDYLLRSRAASFKMGQLIDDLLELSRVSRFKLVKERVDLSEQAHAVATLLKESDPEREVKVEIAPGLTTLGDKILLGQVLENLMGNAWKYTARTEHPRLTVGAQGKGRERAFFVSDNGAGFDMAYRDKLFGAFQRLHGDEYEGTGIGLATVKRIIDRHGGEVWAEAMPDAGATFYFSLP